jgi:hypothetical protein
MINLIIKGNMFDAFNASHARGIALRTAATFNDRPSEVVASCDDSALDAVRVWFMASDAADIVPGFGYPAGALLFYSDKRSAAYNDERAAPPCCQFHASGGDRALSCGGDNGADYVARCEKLGMRFDDA